jgi:hypothetical protein
MTESPQYEWLKMVCRALLEGKDINLRPYIGIALVRRHAEKVKSDVLAIEASMKELENYVSQLTLEERKEYRERLNAAEEKRLMVDSEWRRQMRRGD